MYIYDVCIVYWTSVDIMCGQCQLELDQRTEQYNELLSSKRMAESIATAACAAVGVLVCILVALCCWICWCKNSHDTSDDVGGAHGLKVQV